VTPPVGPEPAAARARTRPAPRERPEPARHLRVVDERAAKRERQVRRGIVLFGLVSVVSVFVVVVLHVMVAQGQLQLDRLNRETTGAQQQYERLRLEVAQLSAPSRIATRAQQLGMVPGGPSTFVTVPDASGPAAQSTPSSSTEDYQKVKPHLETRP